MKTSDILLKAYNSIDYPDSRLTEHKQMLMSYIDDPASLDILPEIFTDIELLNIALKTLCKDIDYSYTETIKSVKGKIYAAFFSYKILRINHVYKDNKIYPGFKRINGVMYVEEDGEFVINYSTIQQLNELDDNLHPVLEKYADLLNDLLVAYMYMYCQHIDKFNEFIDQYRDKLSKLYEEDQ